MSGDNSKNGGQGQTVREAASKLLADLDAEWRGVPPYERIGDSAESLRHALQSEPSVALMVERPELVGEGIQRMRSGDAISADHIQAIVEAAQIALSDSLSATLRWDADMRAIKRWQAAGEGRELIWPDHADLLVWLLELVEVQPTCPSIHDVAALIKDLRKFPASKLFGAAADQLEQMANALVASSRRTVKAEAINAQLIEQMRRDREARIIISGEHDPEAQRQWEEMIERGGGKVAEAGGSRPKVYDSLRFVLGRPDVQEAVAKALCAQRGESWQGAMESGRQAYRSEAAALLREAIDAPREGG